MLKKLIHNWQKGWFFKWVVTGGIAGGFGGAIAGFLLSTYALVFPGAVRIFRAIPVDAPISGFVLGAFIGIGISCLAGVYSQRNQYDSHADEIKLKLHEERLDISRKRVKTGEVTVRKEIIRGGKNVFVPVNHEELVIEKKITDDEANEHTETIRIPISEEHVEIIKRPVVLEDVTVYKRQIQAIEHVNETLKKEKIHIEITGNPDLIDKDIKENK